MAVKYIKLYLDMIVQTEKLNDEELGRLVRGMLSYAASGEAPVLPGREDIIFPVFLAQIDRDGEAYENRIEGGRRGGRAKSTEDT